MKKQNCFFHLKKDSERTRSCTLQGSLTVTLLSCIALCLCFTAGTWAWLDAMVSASQTLEAKEYTISTEISETEGILETLENGYLLTPELNAGTATVDSTNTSDSTVVKAGTFTVKLTPGGTASIGYCQIEIENGEEVSTYYTSPISQGSVFQFTIQTSLPLTLHITPSWGTYSGKSREAFMSSDTVLIFGDVQEIDSESTEEDDESDEITESESQVEDQSSGIEPGSQTEEPTSSAESDSQSEEQISSSESVGSAQGSSTESGDSASGGYSDGTSSTGKEESSSPSKNESETAESSTESVLPQP